jgi:DNA-binding transcriptional LysR family regulator
MDWDRLRIFHAVADVKSLTGAGEVLGLSQSAVSRQISALESDLETKLFVRHARGLILTDEGEILYDTVKNIFNALNTAKGKIIDKKDSYSGVLKIATTTAVGTVWLPTRLLKFTEKYPHIHFEFTLTDGDVDFSTREADIAIRFGNDQVIHPDLIVHHLFDVNLRIYGSETYFEKHGKPKTLEDLSKHQLIVYGSNAIAPAKHVNMLLRIGAAVFESRKPFIQMANAFGILQCVRHGLGIALLADYIANDYDDLIPILPDVKQSINELIMIYPKELEGSKRIEAF